MPDAASDAVHDARLGIVQAQALGGEGGVVLTGCGGQGGAEPVEGGSVVAAVRGQEVLGLFLEVADVGPGGKALAVGRGRHEDYLRASGADGPQIRLHKRWWMRVWLEGSAGGSVPGPSSVRCLLASGFNPFRGPGGGLQPRMGC